MNLRNTEHPDIVWESATVLDVARSVLRVDRGHFDTQRAVFVLANIVERLAKDDQDALALLNAYEWEIKP